MPALIARFSLTTDTALHAQSFVESSDKEALADENCIFVPNFALKGSEVPLGL